MAAAVFIARIFGISYLVIAAGMLVNRDYYRKLMREFAATSGVIFFSGVFALVIGLTIVLVHGAWQANWTAFITFIGWAGIVKGIWLVAFPRSVAAFMAFYEKNAGLLTIHAIAALVMGAVLTYFGFFAA